MNIPPFLQTLLAVLLTAASVSPIATGAETASLVPNGSFETDADSDQWPDGWGKPKTGGSWQAESGNHFLRLTSGTPGENVMLYQQFRIPETVKAIEMTWRMRVSDLKKGKQAWFDARIMMDFKDADGKKLTGPPAPNAGKSTDGWIERSVQFLVPAGAKTLDFMPTLFQVEAGTFDLDDVVLKPAEAAPLAEKATAAQAAALEKQTKDAAAKQAKAGAALEKGGSLISNGDFETDKKVDQWPDDWGHPKGASWELEGANHFLRLKAEEPGKAVLLARTIALPEGAKALELTWRHRVSDLKTGKEPWFDARFMMDFKDAAGKKLSGGPAPNTRKNTDGWIERKVAFLVPEGAVTLDFMPALFQVQKGTFDLDDIVLKPTDPQTLIAASSAADAERKASEIPAEAPQKAKWPQELRVEGNKVLTKDGKPIRLQGVNVVSLEWSVKGEQVLKATQIAIEQWKSNIIRLPVKEEYWFGGGAKDGGTAYRKLVDDVVTLTANRGAYLMLDLHRFKAPRQEHADFWKDAAARYKDHPAVIFDLFNEPHGTSWEVWRNGGFIEEKKKAGDEDNFTTPEEKAKAAKGFQAIGMQALLDAVRGTGARNVVLVGGLDYAYDLSGMANGYALQEKGGNGIILSTHIYPWKKGWQEKVLLVADKYPILVGEVGANTRKMDWLKPEWQEDATTWVPAMLGLIQKHQLHWTAFSFHPKSAPHLLTGWDYTPTPEWGAFVKRALAGEKFELDKLR